MLLTLFYQDRPFPPEQMTPLHIRGKKCNKTKTTIVRKSKKKKLSAASWNRVNAIQTDAALSTRLSRFELLPVELLEQVFSELVSIRPSGTRNLNFVERMNYGRCRICEDTVLECDWENLLPLARASPIVGCKLSSHASKSRLCQLNRTLKTSIIRLTVLTLPHTNLHSRPHEQTKTSTGL